MFFCRSSIKLEITLETRQSFDLLIFYHVTEYVLQLIAHPALRMCTSVPGNGYLRAHALCPARVMLVRATRSVPSCALQRLPLFEVYSIFILPHTTCNGERRSLNHIIVLRTWIGVSSKLVIAESDRVKGRISTDR